MPGNYAVVLLWTSVCKEVTTVGRDHKVGGDHNQKWWFEVGKGAN